MGERSRFAVALLPAIAINAALALALGGLLVMELDAAQNVLPVALLHESPPPTVTPPEPLRPAAPAEPSASAPRRPKRTSVEPPAAETIPEPAPVLVEEPAGPPPAPVVAAAAPPPAAAPAPQPAPPKPDKDALLAKIRAAIQKNLVYPPVARLNRIQGTVGVRFEILPDGTPGNVKVVETSGFKVLDDAAVKTVLASAPLPFVDAKVKVPVVFELE